MNVTDSHDHGNCELCDRLERESAALRAELARLEGERLSDIQQPTTAQVERARESVHGSALHRAAEFCSAGDPCPPCDRVARALARETDTLRASVRDESFQRDRPRVLVIETLEGAMRAEPGDWIIKGVKGEFYPCKPDIFEASYAAVDADERRASGGGEVPASPAPVAGVSLRVSNVTLGED